jgi:hypothetical protein
MKDEGMLAHAPYLLRMHGVGLDCTYTLVRIILDGAPETHSKNQPWSSHTMPFAGPESAIAATISP